MYSALITMSETEAVFLHQKNYMRRWRTNRDENSYRLINQFSNLGCIVAHQSSLLGRQASPAVTKGSTVCQLVPSPNILVTVERLLDEQS